MDIIRYNNSLPGEGYDRSGQYGTSSSGKVRFNDQGQPITAFPVYGE